MSYQWKKEGASLTEGTNNTFALSNVMAGDAGSYTVVVTNLARSVTSAAVVLTVGMAAPMPVVLAPACTGNTFSVQVPTSSGFSYYLEYKTALAAASWSTAAQVAGDGVVKMLSDSSATDPQRVYRIRVQ